MRKKLREKVHDRYNGECFFCGRSYEHSASNGNGHIHVHHINGDDEDDRMDNLILLCGSCHHMVHRRDEFPYRRLHRALPQEKRYTDNAYEGIRKEFKQEPQALLFRYAYTGLPGHRYKRKNTEGEA